MRGREAGEKGCQGEEGLWERGSACSEEEIWGGGEKEGRQERRGAKENGSHGGAGACAARERWEVPVGGEAKAEVEALGREGIGRTKEKAEALRT